MKINISRQYIYLLALCVALLISVLLFSFLVLIPKGKEYREQRAQLKKSSHELRRYEDFHEQIYQKLKKLQSDNRHVISAFSTKFNPQRFQKQNETFFKSLTLTKQVDMGKEEKNFSVYEVNTTSYISSPKSFYNFLDSINKSDWVIKVNFPIHFKRDADMIRSSFTMRVYNVDGEKNKTRF